MSNNFKNKSLLELLTSKEVEELIIEQKFVEKGYKIHYFIDHTDISKYVFPFGLVPNETYDERENKSVEVVTDEQISYDYLINIRKEKLILFDEHKEELEGLKRKFERIRNFGIEIVDSFKIQSEYFESLSKGKAITFEDWSKNQQLSSELNVSLLISIALGSIRGSIQNLNKLTEERIIYKNEDYAKLGFETVITDINQCRPKEKTDELFKNLIDSYTDTPQRLIAKYQKCKVYDRLLCINSKGKNNKEIFLLLSSAKSINERLPKLANDLGFGLEIESMSFNTIRTIQQIYLQLLLKEDDNKIDELTKIRDILVLKENENSFNTREFLTEVVVKRFQEKLTILRDSYENTSLLLKIDNYKQLFKEALQKKEIGDLKILSESILELLRISESSMELERLKSINLYELEFERDCNQILKSAIDNISYGKGSLSAFGGKDYIENVYHTIPFVFHNKGSDRFKMIIDKIVSLATEAIDDNFSSKKLINSINESFTLLYYKTLPNEEERIVMLLILMMIGRNDKYNSDELAYEWLKEMFSTKSISDNWISDFKFIESWVCRRIKKYDESIRIADECLKVNNDPRFYHSLYLSYYCLYRENEKGGIEYLKKSLMNCKMSYEIYQGQNSNSLSIKKSIIANLNSLAYLNTLIYRESNELTYLEDARTKLDELKKSEPNFNRFPEFLHTEALLLLNEFKSNNNFLNKLFFAMDTIEKAININPRPIYLGLKKEIEILITK